MYYMYSGIYAGAISMCSSFNYEHPQKEPTYKQNSGISFLGIFVSRPYGSKRLVKSGVCVRILS